MTHSNDSASKPHTSRSEGMFFHTSPRNTLMHNAVGQDGVIRLLRKIDKVFHANTNRPDKNGFSALQLAAQRGHFSTVDTLIQDGGVDDTITGGCCDTALQLAAAHGHSDIVQLLLNNGANINANGYNNHLTPLQLAVQHGKVEVVRTLLQSAPM